MPGMVGDSLFLTISILLGSLCRRMFRRRDEVMSAFTLPFQTPWSDNDCLDQR